MRWEGQRTEREAARSLPGLQTERVRTFDAPEALGINFHEVRAKSALNKVRGDYLPFDWTVNPFRGCTHACTYCMSGDTRISMADGHVKPLSDVRVGDRIYGTVRGETYRHYAVTEVLAHWTTRKDAYRVVLEDGTELIASGDHRFWTRRGKWKHVVGAQQGRGRRPHLTLNDQLLGTGERGATPGLTGGQRSRLRFIDQVDPAISRKRSIEGMALKSDSDLGVSSIEPLGKRIRMFDITTGTGDFIANGVVSHNCFARNTHTYLDLNAERDFEREIVVKVNVPELLDAEVRRPSWKRELVAFGTNTDPYQWAEGRYELMPPMLESLRDTMTPVSVLSKSPLPVRDIELYKEIGEVADVSVNFSIPTLDEKVWRETEPHTPSPRKRLEAVAEFNAAGIPSGVLVAPLMPGINDSPEQVEPIVEACRDAGATFVNGIALHLRPGVKEVFMSWLGAARPDLVPRYEDMYQERAYAPNAERRRLGSLVKGWNRAGADRRYGRTAARRREAARREAAKPPATQQGSLF